LSYCVACGLGFFLKAVADGPPVPQRVVKINLAFERDLQPPPSIPGNEDTRVASQGGLPEQVEQKPPHFVVGELPPILPRMLLNKHDTGHHRHLLGVLGIWQSGNLRVQLFEPAGEGFPLDLEGALL
jgi:hypothetical protein